VRWADFRRQSVLDKSSFDPRNEIGSIGFIIGVLELTATTFGKMTAWWFLVVGPESERSIVE
jgi:hypothetical protein